MTDLSSWDYWLRFYATFALGNFLFFVLTLSGDLISASALGFVWPYSLLQNLYFLISGQMLFNVFLIAQAGNVLGFVLWQLYTGWLDREESSSESSIPAVRRKYSNSKKTSQKTSKKK